MKVNADEITLKSRHILRVNEEKCEGCGNCEGICPVNNIVKALPQIKKPDRYFIFESKNGSVSILSGQNCVECGRCVGACPAGAIELSDGKLELDREKCTGCGNCRVTCPVDYHIRDFPFVDDSEEEVVVKVQGGTSTVISEHNCIECEECTQKCENDAIALVPVRRPDHAK